MFFSIGEGFYLVTNHAATTFENDTPLIARRIGKTFWGIFEITASDLVLLRHSVENGAAMPVLESLRSICIGRTRQACIANLGKLDVK